MDPRNAIQMKFDLRKAVLDHGVRAGLIHLNGTVRHRFTALYRFGGDALHNIFYFDREHPSIQVTDDVPLGVTYCVYVRDSGAPLTISNSLVDEKYTEHPSRRAVQAYCGVPLIDGSGRMFGSLCHFDVAPADIEPIDLELMTFMGELLIERERALPHEPTPTP